MTNIFTTIKQGFAFLRTRISRAINRFIGNRKTQGRAADIEMVHFAARSSALNNQLGDNRSMYLQHNIDQKRSAFWEKVSNTVTTHLNDLESNERINHFKTHTWRQEAYNNRVSQIRLVKTEVDILAKTTGHTTEAGLYLLCKQILEKEPFFSWFKGFISDIKGVIKNTKIEDIEKTTNPSTRLLLDDYKDISIENENLKSKGIIGELNKKLEKANLEISRLREKNVDLSEKNISLHIRLEDTEKKLDLLEKKFLLREQEMQVKFDLVEKKLLLREQEKISKKLQKTANQLGDNESTENIRERIEINRSQSLPPEKIEDNELNIIKKSPAKSKTQEKASKSYNEGKWALQTLAITKDKGQLLDVIKHFSIAKKQYNKVLKVSPEDKKATERLKEMEEGNYSNESIGKAFNK